MRGRKYWKYVKIAALLAAMAALLLWASGCRKTLTAFGSVSGVVVDNWNQPIPGAVVTLDGQTATTGADGKFQFLDVTAGRKQVEVASVPNHWTVDSVAVDVAERAETTVTVVMNQGKGLIAENFNFLGDWRGDNRASVTNVKLGEDWSGRVTLDNDAQPGVYWGGQGLVAKLDVTQTPILRVEFGNFDSTVDHAEVWLGKYAGWNSGGWAEYDTANGPFKKLGDVSPNTLFAANLADAGYTYSGTADYYVFIQVVSKADATGKASVDVKSITFSE